MIRRDKSGRQGPPLGARNGRSARYRRPADRGLLQKEVPGYEPFTPSDPEHLRGIIEQGDVLLIEGNNRISGIIKYLTQSTWSHAALYVGPIDGAAEPNGEPHVLIEANIGEGVTSAPLSKYFPYHTRLCRPIGLSFEDRTTVCRYAINRFGFGYDTKNILDLMRYLFPLPIRSAGGGG